VFTPKEFHLSDIDERIRYDSHQNNPKDKRYRQFLSQAFNPVMEFIQPGNTGLDFGCGPGPTLSIMFEEQGYKVDLFDKFYANDQAIFDNQYDFITATEVVEHLAKPGDELNRLYKMLNTGGTLAIMTKMINNQIDFASWHYKDDPTHICFFSQQTMEYLAKAWGSRIQFYGHDITLFFK
jgi:2-polyprenyl-3-methyl-5-hydroxy-6-metoxy-1,4-benzoquinol methylase